MLINLEQLQYTLSLSNQFSYLNEDINAKTLPTYIRYYNLTNEPVKYTFNHLLTGDTYNNLYNHPIKYPYDMTAYKDKDQFRYQDSILVAKAFSEEWKAFTEVDDNYPDLIFKDTFHGARRCLQFLKTPEEIVNYYFKMAKIARPTCMSEIMNSSLQRVIPFFSHMKAYLHKHIDELPPIAYCYSELDTIAGYPLEASRALTDDPVQWLTLDVKDEHTEEWWATQIYSVLIKGGRRSTDILYSFTDFLKKPWLWVTSGASSESKLYLGSDRVSSKFGAAMSLSYEELLSCVYHALNPKSVNMDIFVKQDEKGYKRRLIANMDLGSYLVAAYIRYLIEWLDGTVPYWMTATTNVFKDSNVIEALREHNTAIPLDESQFDHHLSRNAWLGFLKAMSAIFPNNFGVKLFHILFANTNFISPIDGQKYSWRKGMPSGLAITALGNTLFNYVKQQPLISPIHFALGDDVLLISKQYSLDFLAKYYESFGAEINTKKNWLSPNYAEYLHFLYCKHGRVGIPARIYGSLIYGLQFKDVTPLQRINELATMFKDFYDRAVLPFDFQLVGADLSRAVSKRWAGFKAADAIRWLHIPKALNGFGFLPYRFEQFNVKNTDGHKLYYTGTPYKLKPQFIVDKSEYSFTSYKYHRANYKCGNKYRFPEIQSMEQWVKRINMEDETIPRRVQEMGGSVIPLPEIPYVSTSRMSHFAERWKFNIYPNIRGNKQNLVNKLIFGSLMLAELVTHELRLHRWQVYV